MVRMLNNFSLIVFISNICIIICINPISKIIKFDEGKKQNVTELSGKLNLTSSYIGYCKHFEIDLDHEIFVTEMETFGKNGFDSGHNIHEIDIALCQTPRPKQTTSEEGTECKNLGGMQQDFPDDIKSCMKMYTILQPMAQKNHLKLASDEGFKFGTPTTRFVMLYTHFHLHDKSLVNTIVEYGLRIWHTTEHKPNNLGILPSGPVISFTGIIIPPKQPRWVTAGHCSYECFKEKRPNGVYIIGTMAHVHTHASGQIVRHFRGDQELPKVYEDNKVGMKTGGLTLIGHPVHFKPGDSLTVECFYNTSYEDITITQTSRTNVKDEMCVSMLYYYPYIEDDLDFCGSFMTEKTLIEGSGIKDMKIDGFMKKVHPKIEAPEHLKGQDLMDFYISKTEYRKDIQQLFRFSKQKAICNGMSEWPPKRDIDVGYPDNWIKNLNQSQKDECELI